MVVAGPGAEIESVSAGRIVVNLLLSAADLLTAFSAGAKVYLERDTSSAFAAPTVLSSTAIVSGTEQLEFVDTSGTSSSWYRVRVGNTGGTAYTDYSSGLQASSLRAYASIDDLLETMPSVPSTATRERNLLADLLVDSSDVISQVCGRSFFRSPQISGTETRVFHVINAGQRSLARAIGESIDIVPGSIVSIEIADQTGGTYTTIAAGSAGYWQEPQNLATGFPIEDILLSTAASILTYPLGDEIGRIVAAFGWAAVPSLVKRATIDLAREWYRQGPGGGGPIGIGALGQPVFGSGTPPTVWQLWRSDYRRRSFSYV